MQEPLKTTSTLFKVHTDSTILNQNLKKKNNPATTVIDYTLPAQGPNKNQKRCFFRREGILLFKNWGDILRQGISKITGVIGTQNQDRAT